MLKTATILVLLAFASNSLAADSADLTKLQGKWSTKGPGSDGQEARFTMEIKGEKLTFQAFRGDNELRFVAQGKVKAEMQGPFQVMKITQIEAGATASDLQPVNDDRSTVYFLKDDTLALASNFDKEREGEKPRLEVYQRVATKAASVSGDMAKLVGKWKMTVKLGEDDRDYDISFAEADGKLTGTLISPRSGEYKFKSVTFSDGKLAMELPRTIEGNEVVFVYTGQLKGSELAGDVIVKGYEDQFKGSWTAKK